MKTTTEALEWAAANLPAVEEKCDQAAAAAELMGDDDPTLPALEFADRERESKLLGCLQVRPGGLDHNTPSRTREWLWRGLNKEMTESRGQPQEEPGTVAAKTGDNFATNRGQPVKNSGESADISSFP